MNRSTPLSRDPSGSDPHSPLQIQLAIRGDSVSVAEVGLTMPLVERLLPLPSERKTTGFCLRAFHTLVPTVYPVPAAARPR
jgi:hypothetical protein